MVPNECSSIALLPLLLSFALLTISILLLTLLTFVGIIDIIDFVDNVDIVEIVYAVEFVPLMTNMKAKVENSQQFMR